MKRTLYNVVLPQKSFGVVADENGNVIAAPKCEEWMNDKELNEVDKWARDNEGRVDFLTILTYEQGEDE